MSWSTAVTELRVKLSDGDTDRYHFRKRCLGEVDGVNTRFKTFEFRRITDFTATQGVYVDNVLQNTSAISSDSPSTGEFILTIPPADGGLVEASYYTQWFIDTELTSFLTNASRWILSSDDYTVVPSGLIPCVLNYAASEAYQKMAERWRTYASETYKLEDAPKDEVGARVDSFIKMAGEYRDIALKQRDEFYTRQGRKLQPLFGRVLGRVPNLP